jgi:hypothetical protein
MIHGSCAIARMRALRPIDNPPLRRGGPASGPQSELTQVDDAQTVDFVHDDVFADKSQRSCMTLVPSCPPFEILIVPGPARGHQSRFALIVGGLEPDAFCVAFDSAVVMVLNLRVEVTNKLVGGQFDAETINHDGTPALRCPVQGPGSAESCGKRSAGGWTGSFGDTSAGKELLFGEASTPASAWSSSDRRSRSPAPRGCRRCRSGRSRAS